MSYSQLASQNCISSYYPRKPLYLFLFLGRSREQWSFWVETAGWLFVTINSSIILHSPVLRTHSQHFPQVLLLPHHCVQRSNGHEKKMQSDNMHTMGNLCLCNYIQYSLAINVESSDDLGLLPQLQ